MDIRSRELVAIAVAALLLFLAAVGGAAWLRPQSVQVLNSADAEHSLTSTGEAELEVKPDTAQVTLGINIKAGDAKTAQAQANEKLRQVVDALKTKGIPEDKIRTASFNLQPEYRYDSGAAKLDGYRVFSNLEVTTTDLGQVGDLIDMAIAAGANQVQGVSFTLKDRDQFKQQAIDKALADARSKAEGAVKKLGTEITGVRHVVIQEGNTPPPVIYKALDERSMASAAEATPVLPGSFSFRVSVQVEFGLK